MPITQAQATINGKPLVFETGKYAAQAGGAATVRYGDTVVFAAATVAKTTRPGIDFFPLTVDFEERLYAAGKKGQSGASASGRSAASSHSTRRSSRSTRASSISSSRERATRSSWWRPARAR